ncbi:hypothetical protein EYY60_11675 [Flavobacterium zhairuonense]|uniref:hypothetical protein n=1 Tax=Flavobacterium zhairuonense TaxID=2493631 RepID=UPI00104AFB7F|nr:hypothetical protein [Flavobacterium zhairuonense]KAF2510163.1 hypothetical protein EYY60_11675 [Flavobacterium zhairuonense]
MNANFPNMTKKNYTESKLYISPKILIMVGVILIAFWPITIFMYGIPFLLYLIGVILLWAHAEKFTHKTLWTIVPIIVMGLVFYNFFIK